MNILMVTAYPPLLHRHGGGVRMYHNIRILSQKHSVRVLSFAGSDEECDLIPSLRSICDSAQAVRRIPDFRPHWLSTLPFMVREFSTPEMHHAVDKALRDKRIDVLQCEYLQMAQFRRPGTPNVLTAHEALSKNGREDFEKEIDPIEKLRLFYRWMQMLNYEIAQIRKFDCVITMTDHDAQHFRSYARDANIRAVPIGIDTREFSPFPPDPNAEICILFMGNFYHSPNVEAARFLRDRIAPRFPGLRFVIPGSPRLDDFVDEGNVSFPGYVPDTRVLYQRPNTIVAAPLFSGTGQRVKLLEAFAMGCPVITTTVGSLGFPVRDGEEALIANTAQEFEAALLRLVASEELRRRLGENARRMIVEKFGWDRISEDLWDVVAQAAVSN